MFLSVVVPVYRTRPWLARLVESFDAQAARNFEVIAVDDGSPDGSGDALEAMARTRPWLRVFPRPHAGLSAARNFGLSQTGGEIVAMVDSDDWVNPDFVARTLAPFRSTRCTWTVRPVQLAFEDRLVTVSTRYDGRMPDMAPQGGFVEAAAVPERLAWWPSVWNKAFRREMIRRNWFDDGLLFEDHAFNIRNYALEPRFYFHPHPVYVHRRERAGQITASTGGENAQIFACFDRWAEAVRRSGVVDQGTYLHGLVTRLFDERMLRLAPAEREVFLDRLIDWGRQRGLDFTQVRLPREADQPDLAAG